MITKYTLAGLTLLFSLAGYTQNKQYLYYFDREFNTVSKPKSVFNGVGIFEDGVLEFKLYDSRTSLLLATEHYTDSTLTTQDGPFQNFYGNSTVSSQGNYIKGLQDGVWMRWDSARHLIDSTIYSNGKKVLEIHTGYYGNGKLDSLIVNDIKSDLLDKKYYNDKGRLVSEASFVGQNGIVKYYDSLMQVTTNTATSRLEIEAAFPGGDQAWTRYIVSELQKNADRLQDAGVSGTCRVKFIVSKDGSISAAEPLTMKGTKLAKIAVSIILKAPRWTPASQYGRYVNAYREQPITFTVQGR